MRQGGIGELKKYTLCTGRKYGAGVCKRERTSESRSWYQLEFPTSSETRRIVSEVNDQLEYYPVAQD